MTPPPFRTFPKIHPFWNGSASLTPKKRTIDDNITIMIHQRPSGCALTPALIPKTTHWPAMSAAWGFRYLNQGSSGIWIKIMIFHPGLNKSACWPNDHRHRRGKVYGDHQLQQEQHVNNINYYYQYHSQHHYHWPGSWPATSAQRSPTSDAPSSWKPFSAKESQSSPKLTTLIHIPRFSKRAKTTFLNYLIFHQPWPVFMKCQHF